MQKKGVRHFIILGNHTFLFVIVLMRTQLLIGLFMFSFSCSTTPLVHSCSLHLFENPTLHGFFVFSSSCFWEPLPPNGGCGFLLLVTWPFNKFSREQWLTTLHVCTCAYGGWEDLQNIRMKTWQTHKGLDYQEENNEQQCESKGRGVLLKNKRKKTQKTFDKSCFQEDDEDQECGGGGGGQNW
jgi:hypothetical protein